MLTTVTLAGALIGSVSLTGSLIAWAKLDGKINKTWRFKGQKLLNGGVFALAVGLAGSLAISAGAICGMRQASMTREVASRSPAISNETTPPKPRICFFASACCGCDDRPG